jgi:hypothetical protein
MTAGVLILGPFKARVLGEGPMCLRGRIIDGRF